MRSNHSATHLLQRALREILGEHVAQKGSEVGPAFFRFDFSHLEAVTADQLRLVEEHVNAEVRLDEPSRTEVLPFEEAQRSGAMALFGEKYGDTVRVVHIGSRSMELCGGTHVARAGQIGLFKIVSEEALALGVRRIVAVTGAAALARVQETEAALGRTSLLLRTSPDKVEERVAKLLEKLRETERQVAELRRRLAVGGGGGAGAGGGRDLLEKVREVAGVKLLASRVEAADPKTLREAGDTLRDRLGSGVLVLGGEHNGKAALLVMVSKDLASRFHAGKIVGKLAEIVGGKGGGRPDMAQAGGPLLDRLDEALSRAGDLLV